MLLLTGIPGIGKTTVIRRVASLVGAKRLGGFYTEEIREHGQRVGFRLVDFAGRHKTIIAHIAFPHTYRVGKYGVDVAAIDEATGFTLLLNTDIDLYLVDEIGKMECLSTRFVAAMQLLLDSSIPLVATISKKGGGFIQEVKLHPDAQLWEVTRENRDALPDRIIDWLGTRDMIINGY